jgi:subtilisin family serine protease
MRIFKLTTFAVASAMLVASCGSIKNKEVPAMDISVNVSAKQGTVSDEAHNHWAHTDLSQDTIAGISLDKAYEFVADKKGETVIVAVIDSGIDIEHEDLENVLWKNEDEIEGNGIDDDKNGYIDDIYGWNYLGGDRVAAPEQLEVTRLLAAFGDKFTGKKLEDIAEEDKAEFNEYKKILKAYNASSSGHKQTMKRLQQIGDSYIAVKKFVGKEEISLDDMKSIETLDPEMKAMVSDLISLNSRGLDEAAFNDYWESQLKNKNYDLNFDGRAIVGDEPNDFNDKVYGNNVVIGSKEGEIHGTHVAGIILAERNNGIGMNGVAHNAQLMSLRAIPDGDERDKDVALAIRYAVDNGAKVINMSFGKSFSPNKEWVFDAIKYAEDKDVLLVHAAGNDHKDIDRSDNWPSDSEDKIVEFADNVLTVGALSVNTDKNLPATFSNYGKRNVDVFAPGVDIYSTFPLNEYQKISGTSMASPEVAGIATLIRSYYPELSASQVKHIIMNSATKLKMQVLKPGESNEVPFSTLSITGGAANAYQALKLADQMVNGK